MTFVKVIFHNKEYYLPRNNLEVSELICLFKVKPEGMHLKYQICDAWKNVWPVAGIFQDIPTPEVYLIAVESGIGENPSIDTCPAGSGSAYFSSGAVALNYSPGATVISTCGIPTFTPTVKKTMSTKSLKRRGNAACDNVNFYGARTVPGFKNKSVPVPLKKKICESCFKIIFVSDVEIESEDLDTIFECPIDLTKLENMYGNFTIDHIQKEVGFQIGGSVFILTNKRGNPIRDMPNTRGKSNCAIAIEKFKMWKPEVWQSIKDDYLSITELDEDEDDDILAQSIFPDLSVQTNNISYSTYTSNNELKELTN